MRLIVKSALLIAISITAVVLLYINKAESRRSDSCGIYASSVDVGVDSLHLDCNYTFNSKISGFKGEGTWSESEVDGFRLGELNFTQGLKLSYSTDDSGMLIVFEEEYQGRRKQMEIKLRQLTNSRN